MFMKAIHKAERLNSKQKIIGDEDEIAKPSDELHESLPIYPG